MKAQMRFRISGGHIFGVHAHMRYRVEAKVSGKPWYNPVPGAVRIDTLREAFDQIETLANVFNIVSYRVKVTDVR